MTYNNIINHLKIWCRNNKKGYKKFLRKTYINSLIADKLEFKLSTLIDVPFDDVDSLKRELTYYIDTQCRPAVLNPENRFEKNVINKTVQDFCIYMDDILSRCDELDTAEIPYERMIIGVEAVLLRNKFYSVWKYGDSAYWYPLEKDNTESVEKLFIMSGYFAPYIQQFKQMIGLPETHLYCFGEDFISTRNYVETNDLDEYYGSEMFYTNKNFSWAIYFSHENTVTFAGSIVPKVKELLSNEKVHWNDFEW